MKRWLVVLVALGLMVLLPTPFVGQPPDRVAHAAARPNILFIVTDDQRDEGTMAVMPNTRQIFQQGGTTFSNAYDSTPLCCPARASLWTGQYSHNHGMLTNSDPATELIFDQTHTLQYYLSNQGYMTALVGKYWNDWPKTKPAPYFQHNAMISGGYINTWFNVDGAAELSPYSTDGVGQFAVDDLQSFESNDSQPWFLYLATHAPHSIYQPAPKYASAPVPAWNQSPAVFEADRSDKPPIVQTRTASVSEVTSARTQQLRTLMSVDDMVKQVFDTLNALGEQDTIAVFLSDNGFLWGEHGQIAKRFPYEDSIGVPMMIRWPGHITAGAVDNRLTSQIDITPTVMEALGIVPSYPIDGAPLFDGGARSRLFLEYTQSPDDPGPRTWASDLTPTYQYVEWFNPDGTLYAREYYNLVNDPYQLTNLYQDGVSSNDPPIAPLHAQLIADRACVGSTCPRPVITTPDTTPPSAPGTPTGTSTRAGQIDLSWAAATDDRATSLSYRVFRDGGSTAVATVQGPTTGTVTFTDPGLQPGSQHTYAVDAFDGTNRGPRSGTSQPITVASGAASIFSDNFTAGFANWSGVTNLSIDNTTGGVAPPSARSQLTSVPDFAFKNLTGSFNNVCMSTRVNVASIGSSTVTVLRLRTAANGNVIRVFANQAGVLHVRSDVSGTQKWSGVAIGSGWHTVELCGTVGANSTWDLYRDGAVIVNDWAANTGTTGVGRVEIGDTLAKIWNVHFDDVVVDQTPG